jgi:hypothetical protein
VTVIDRHAGVQGRTQHFRATLAVIAGQPSWQSSFQVLFLLSAVVAE